MDAPIDLIKLTGSRAGFYAGIGSRETPPEICEVMTQVAYVLDAMGWTLRSGGADGADIAFENGANRKEIFLPYKGFNKNTSPLYHIDPRAFEIAKAVHPAWDRCNDFARKAHARNAHQVLGKQLNDPVSFLMCWTGDGATSKANSFKTGGSRTAIVLAADNGAPVINLARPEHLKMVKAFIYRNADLLPVPTVTVKGATPETPAAPEAAEKAQGGLFEHGAWNCGSKCVYGQPQSACDAVKQDRREQRSAMSTMEAPTPASAVTAPPAVSEPAPETPRPKRFFRR